MSDLDKALPVNYTYKTFPEKRVTALAESLTEELPLV
jgi:hypothetical protein